MGSFGNFIFAGGCSGGICIPPHRVEWAGKAKTEDLTESKSNGGWNPDWRVVLRCTTKIVSFSLSICPFRRLPGGIYSMGVKSRCKILQRFAPLPLSQNDAMVFWVACPPRAQFGAPRPEQEGVRT